MESVVTGQAALEAEEACEEAVKGIAGDKTTTSEPRRRRSAMATVTRPNPPEGPDLHRRTRPSRAGSRGRYRSRPPSSCSRCSCSARWCGVLRLVHERRAHRAGRPQPEWIGLDNYTALSVTPTSQVALAHRRVRVPSAVVGQNVLGHRAGRAAARPAGQARAVLASTASSPHGCCPRSSRRSPVRVLPLRRAR